MKLLIGLLVIASVAAQRGGAQTAATMTADVVRSAIVTVTGITFEAGGATLEPASEKALTEVVQMMTEHGDWRFEVQGHTDNARDAAANLELSTGRAQAVVAWLVAHGIPAARLSAKGYGESKPVAENATPAGREKNRRIDFKKLNEE